MSLRTFNEPSEFAAAIRGARVELTLVGSGRFAAELVDTDLCSSRIQRLSQNLPLIMHMANKGERASFIFHTKPGPSIFRDSIEVTSNRLVRVGESRSHFHRTPGPMSLGSISLPTEAIPFFEQAGAGFDLTPPVNEQIVTPSPAALTRLRRLHAAAGSSAADSPGVIPHPEAARALEQAMMEALAACLGGNDVYELTSTQRRHQTIMRRFQAVLEAAGDRPLYVLEMATAVGASLRSLSMCCQAHLGMGPKRYLLLRRMHLARQALCLARPSATTVTDVATQHGFWQFGRFAGEYKFLFGELPSITLQRAAA